MEHEIKIDKNLPEKELQLLNDYWKLEGDTFVNKPGLLIKAYKIQLKELTKLVRASSECKIILNYCEICGHEISKVVHSQSTFKYEIKYRAKQCESCEIEQRKEREREYYEQLEEENSRIEEEKRARKIKFETALSTGRLSELNDEELNVLCQIVKLKSKQLIYRDVFGGRPFEKPIWNIVRSIERKGLIEVVRQGTKVLFFDFHPTLEDILFGDGDNEQVRQLLNSGNELLSVSLTKNFDRIATKTPDYKGTFVLEKIVKLVPGIRYTYEGRTNSDGSIHLEIRPLENIITTPQPYERVIDLRPDIEE